MVAAQQPQGRSVEPRPPRALSAVQERAIRAAMYTFVEDDLAFGSARGTRRWCRRCRAQRPAPGFVAYDEGSLCNPCATAYELARARDEVRTPAEFLGR